MIRAALLFCAAACLWPQTIVSLRPFAATAGAPPFSLAVSGAGFTPVTRVLWNGAPLATQFESDALLKAQVGAAQLGRAGRATVSAGSSSADFMVNQPLELVGGTPAAAAIGVFYTHALVAVGGTPPYRFSILRGLLPDGFQLNATTGGIAGFPSIEGTFEFTAEIRDVSDATLVRVFQIFVGRQLAILADALPAAVAGRPYQAALRADGGRAPYSGWQFLIGTVPPGITLDPTGVLGGTPAASGIFDFTVRVRDAGGAIAARAFTLLVQSALRILPAPLSEVTLGEPLTLQLKADGGAPPYSWSAAGLPAGVSLDSAAGVVSGTPSVAPGDYAATITVRDASAQTATTALRLTIVAPLAVASQTLLPGATVGVTYSQALKASGGSGAQAWRLAGGTLPPGIQMDAGGKLGGVARGAGDFTFRAEVRDAGGRVASQLFSLSARMPVAPTVRLLGLPDQAPPAQQIPVRITLGEPSPVDVNGEVELAGVDDPGLQFSTGGRTASFRITAGATETSLKLQTGTVAGQVSVSVRLLELDPQPAPFRFTIPAAAPVLRAAEAGWTGQGLEFSVYGFATTRSVDAAVFRFRGGADLGTSELTLPLSAAASAWFSSDNARAFGGQFRYRQVFRVEGAAGAVEAVSVVLRSQAGESETVEVKLK